MSRLSDTLVGVFGGVSAVTDLRKQHLIEALVRAKQQRQAQQDALAVQDRALKNQNIQSQIDTRNTTLQQMLAEQQRAAQARQGLQAVQQRAFPDVGPPVDAATARGLFLPALANAAAQTGDTSRLSELLGVGKQPNITTDAAGFKRNVATGARLFPDVVGKPPKTGRPVRVPDATSPTGFRFISAADALGQAASPPSSTSISTNPDGTFNFSQGANALRRGRVPSGFRQTKDGNLEPIPGGPKARQTPEQAGKTQQLEQAKAEVEAFAKGIIRHDGSVDFANVAKLVKLPFFAPGIPFSEGRKLRTLFSDATEARLRAETGAAATESEINRLRDRFIPRITDTSETIRLKIRLLRDFLNGALRKIDPTQSFTDPNSVIKVGGKFFRISSKDDTSKNLIDARNAIDRGADRNAVIKMLIQKGEDPSRL